MFLKSPNSDYCKLDYLAAFNVSSERPSSFTSSSKLTISSRSGTNLCMDLGRNLLRQDKYVQLTKTSKWYCKTLHFFTIYLKRILHFSYIISITTLVPKLIIY